LIYRWRAVLPTLAALVLAACSQTGDLGRVRDVPGSLNNVLFDRGPDPRAELNRTDAEREMIERVHRFVSPVPGQPWMRRDPEAHSDRPFPPVDAYYDWLRKQRFASSHARYNRLRNDIRADIQSIPAAFEAVCRVEQIDRRRSIAAKDLVRADPFLVEARARRHAQNRARIAHFSAAIEYRYEAYVHALESLLIETPHREAREIDAELSELADASRRAGSGRYCGDASFALYAKDGPIDL